MPGNTRQVARHVGRLSYRVEGSKDLIRCQTPCRLSADQTSTEIEAAPSGGQDRQTAPLDQELTDVHEGLLVFDTWQKATKLAFRGPGDPDRHLKNRCDCSDVRSLTAADR